MKSSKYLYDKVNLKELENKTYRESLEIKIQWGKELLRKLISVHYTERDDERIFHVSNAINFNRILLKELDKSYIVEQEYDENDI